MKKYIAPHIKVVSMEPDNVVLGHSFDWADVKAFKKPTDEDEDLWDDEEEEVVTTAFPKPSNLWDKAW
ncbi:MAG: hypothetical protein IJ197_04890 [Bacteroidaceae bacterium]|nr:hypothetical protein [Bacteroidaceae bacterium]